MSTSANRSRPASASVPNHDRIVQYMSAGATTSVPGASASSSAVAAAMPEANSNDSAPPSSSVSSASAGSPVGFWSRL